MNINGILIPADAEVQASKVEFDPSLQELQRFVEGEAGVADVPDASASLWFNEDGRASSLMVNYRATFLLWLYRPEFARVGDLLVGNVLVTGLTDEEGDPQAAPGELAALLLETEHYTVTWRFIGKEQRNYQTVVFNDWPTAFEYACQMQHRNRNIEEVRVVPA